MQLNDVHRVSPDLAFALQRRMGDNLGATAAALSEEELAALKAELPISVCPNCSLVIEKIEGCDTLICVCGKLRDGWNT